MTLYRNFLIWGVSSSDENEARFLKWKANYYVILDGEISKRGLIAPSLKCLNNQQADYVMRELLDRIFPRLYKEVQTMPKVCKHSTHPSWQSPQSELPLTFCHVWNAHIETTAKGPRSNQILTGCHRLLHQVDISKTKKREITASEVKKFTWKHLICRYGLPYTIVMDNDTQVKAHMQVRRLPDKGRCQAPCHTYRTSSDQWSGKGI